MNRPAGFTLIEMAVAIFIIGLLLGSIFVPLQTQLEQRQIRDAEIYLGQARDAIIGFAAANGYLPCPDLVASNDGIEDITGGTTCTADAARISYGLVPSSTLNLTNSADPWRNRFRYRVVSAYAARPGAITTTTNATLRVCSTNTCSPATTILTNSANPNDQAVFVLISQGRNGRGAISAVGETNLAAVTADEMANAGTANAVSRVTSSADSASGDFDDIVLWVGRAQLVRNLIAVGRIP